MPVEQLIEASKSNFRELLPVLENVGTRVLKAKGLVNAIHFQLKFPKSAEEHPVNLHDYIKTIRQDWNSLQ
jgi:hypothetical protein